MERCGLSKIFVDIPIDVDLVNVFHLSHDVPPHVEDILARMPKAVWLQSGIRNDAAAQTLAKPGSKSFSTLAARVQVTMA
jgi:predicted CoA-binding protein